MRHVRRSRTLALIAFVLVVAGCSDDDSPTQPTDAGISFAADVQPIFDLRCALVCHTGPAANGSLDLSADVSHANLVNVPAAGYTDEIRVVPGDADASLLYQKVIGDVFGNRMPLGEALPDSQIAIIRVWIEDGARDD